MHYLYYHTTSTPCAQYLSITPLSHCIHQTVQRYTPYHNICFNALFHFLHRCLSIYIYRIHNIYIAPFPSLYRSKLYLDIHSKKYSYSISILFFTLAKWLFESRSVDRLRSLPTTQILRRVSSRGGEEPDEYPDKQPVAWPARSISVQAQHPQPFFPSSQSASRSIPLRG